VRQKAGRDDLTYVMDFGTAVDAASTRVTRPGA
jgi:hypothetical protein